MDPSAITAAAADLRFVGENLAAIRGMTVDAEVLRRVVAAQERLGNSQDTLRELRDELFALQSENEKLKREKAAQDSWSGTAARYELTKTSGGAVVYKHKGEPAHYTCPNCWNKKEAQPLQDNRTLSGKHRCTACQAEFPVDPHKPFPDPGPDDNGGSSWVRARRG